jgi:hypothetical protein
MKPILPMGVCLVVTAFSLSAASSSDHSNRTQSQMTPVSQQSDKNQSASKKSMMSMPLVAPLFIADANTSSTLTLVHDLDMAITVDIRVVSLAGNTLAAFSQTIPPHGHIAIDMNDRLQKLGIQQPALGSLSVDPGKIRVQLGAQLSLIRNTGPENDIEEELLMLNSSAVNVFRSVATGIVASPTVAISNLAAEPQHVVLSCLQEGRQPVFGRLQIPGSHTILVKGCKTSASPENGIDFGSSQPDVDHSPETFGLSVESDGPAGTMAVFGVAPRSPSIYESLPFVQIGTLRSSGSTYPGVPVGVTQPIGSKQFFPELGVTNFGPTPANVKILYSSAAFSSEIPREIANITVPPLTSKAIPFHQLPGDPEIQNSFSVVTDADKGQVISSLRSRPTDDSDQVVDLPNQDPKKPANGGQHPWIIDKNTSSYLLLYNADESSARNVGVMLYTDIGRFSKSVQVMQGHTVALPVDDILKEMKGVNSSDTASPQAEQSQSPQRGIITWLSLDASTVFGRMLQVDKTRLQTKNFSCLTEYIACAATVFPNTTLAPGESNTLWGYANVCPSSGACSCDGGTACTYQTQTVNNNYWSVDNSSIASFSGSTAGQSVTIVGNAAGQTNVQLWVTDDTDYQCSASTSWAYGQPGQITVVPNPCFARLLYRPVIEGGINWGNHSFWWIRNSTPANYVIDAGPTGNCFPDCGYLDDWVTFGDTGHYAADNPNASWDWDSGTYGYVCTPAYQLYVYSVGWPQDETPYVLGGSPNSNTFSHYAANAGGFSPPQPPNTPGW